MERGDPIGQRGHRLAIAELDQEVIAAILVADAFDDSRILRRIARWIERPDQRRRLRPRKTIEFGVEVERQDVLDYAQPLPDPIIGVTQHRDHAVVGGGEPWPAFEAKFYVDAPPVGANHASASASSRK